MTKVCISNSPMRADPTWGESVTREAAYVTRLRTTAWHRLVLTAIHTRQCDQPVRSEIESPRLKRAA
jgi:hypothetical protein